MRIRAPMTPNRAALAGMWRGIARRSVLELGYLLLGHRPTTQLGSALLGMYHLRTSAASNAWQDFSRISNVRLVNSCAEDYFQAGFMAAPEEASRMLRRLIEMHLHHGWGGPKTLGVSQAAFGADHEELTRVLIDKALESRGRLDTHSRTELIRLKAWLSDGEQRRPIPLLPADTRIGVLSYQQPDLSSVNLGDYVQTLAFIGHLLRQRNVTFVGDGELVQFLADASTEVQEKRFLHDARGVVHLFEMHRDASNYQNLPDPTWTVAFGWYMHPVFGRHHFPFHQAVRPIFVSFHMNEPELLTSEALAYLRLYGPVGCRDWQTTAALQAAGVPAFFSGCITSTIDTLFRGSGSKNRHLSASIDNRRVGGGDVLGQIDNQLPFGTLAENLRKAHHRVGSFRDVYGTVHTSRLHSYLPARALGCPVAFEPDNPADVRFGGLMNLDDEQFDRMREGILEKLESITSLIFAGAAEAEVYAAWRESCALEVERSKRFLATYHLPEARRFLRQPPIAAKVPRAVLVELAHPKPEKVEGLLRRLDTYAPGMTAFLVAGVGARGLDAQGLAAVVPGRQLKLLDESPADVDGGSCTHYEHALRMVAALNSLARFERVLLVSGEAAVYSDLSELFETDLGGRLLAARTDQRLHRQNGAALIAQISERQADSDTALEFVAVAHRLTSTGFVAFDASVALIDSGRLDESFCSVTSQLVQAYGLTFQEALNIVVGGNRVEMQAKYYSLPLLATPSAPPTIAKPRMHGYGVRSASNGHVSAR